ncbi:heparan-alpha-glucosaminide N-acetyltransferase domain-containing protein [Corynebacterium glyciniphilum]|uniref:heparan-alpha-glucosaminide N-acetyltransferase domain-containing protein n=1 Tax=Corynebacterium glyciniphilum TaxID=1404244 RepID=UPI0011AB3F08|nr:heparan-alpha-glucosaminide N-acetyltransferase domain-containing protein [Corynebacterium glyciniphilum]
MTTDLPSSSRPAPGPSHVRSIWDGESSIDPGSLRPRPEPEPDPQPSRWTKNAAFGPSGDPRRITGLDAARGFALLGMVAVHTLPAYNDVTDEPTLVWSLFAGHAAVLFGVLAGITVAILTGGATPHHGRELRRSRTSLVTRAVLILVLGLALNQLDPAVYNILPFYGLLFLLAVPLTRLRIRGLLTAAVFFALAGPALIFLGSQWNGYTTLDNPSVTNLVAMPTDTLLTLLVGGAYPVVTWMTYICLGMAVGRMRLRWLVTQIRLLVYGGLTAAVGYGISAYLIDYAGGFSRLYELTPGLDADDIQDILDYGPEGQLPTDTWWWLTTAGPHSNTSFAVIASAGLALLTVGAFLVITRTLNDLCTPLIAIGSMTLTLYTAHLLFLTYIGDSVEDHSSLYFLVQVVTILLFATAWSLARGRGPLEDIVTRTCRTVGRVVVPDRSPGQPGQPGRPDVSHDLQEEGR